jgi:hypothetical protein
MQQGDFPMTAARLVHLGKAASAAAALFALTNPAEAGGTLRVAKTASDVPTTLCSSSRRRPGPMVPPLGSFQAVAMPYQC